MLKDNEKNFSRLHMLIDAVVLALSYFLAWLIRFVGPMSATAVRTRSFQQYMLMLIFIIPVYLLLYQAFTLYTPMRMQGRRLVLANIVKANSLGLLILMFTFYMIDEGKIIFHEDTDVLLNQYGLLKVDEKQFEELDKRYLLKKRKEHYGYACLTKEKQYYIENYPDIVVEKGTVDELIAMMIGGNEL